MNGFRLYNLEIDNKLINTNSIELIDDFISSHDNYFSLLIGNNGTGKSRILSEIAKFFKNFEEHEEKKDLFTHSDFHFNTLPSKVIAVTNSISDKFPTDDSFRTVINKNYKAKHRDLSYNYLGTRNRVHSFSNKALMNRALEIIFESYSEIDVSRNYRHIFDYLNYEPIIKLSYRFGGSSIYSYDKSLLRNITPDALVEYIEQKSNNSSFFKPNESLVNIVKDRAEDLCNFILDKSSSYATRKSLTVNFSTKNIKRIQEDSSLYEDNLYEYELVSILKKIGLVKYLEIQVFKKGGRSFNFSDASSGEANILSTLLALVPLLKNNSLILIDEPEISLHPLWQSRYIDLLNKILENVSGCHIIIASHSPFLASNLKPNNSCVIKLENHKDIISSSKVYKSTYGWSAEDILLNVFEMETTRNFDLYQSVSKALLLLSDDKRSNKELKLIQNNLKSFYPSLLDNDPIKPVIEAIFKAISYD